MKRNPFKNTARARLAHFIREILLKFIYPRSHLEEIINALQIVVSIEIISENSPEEWFLKYKHQEAKTRLCAKKLSNARTELDTLREENSRLKSMNNDLLMNLRAVSSELRSTLAKANSRIRSLTN